MQSRASGSRPLSQISATMLAMFATMASFYVAGRIWQDSQDRFYLANKLDQRTGQGHSSISVDDSLKLGACWHQHKKLAALEMELAAARREGFVGHYSSNANRTYSRKRLLLVIGITTKFGQRKHRDVVRNSWFPTGTAMKRLEREKGVLARFVIGRSANRGDSFDREIDEENWAMKDFIILENHVEVSEEFSKKTKLFFVYAANAWDAQFYAKLHDRVYVNIDTLVTLLASHLDKTRAYIGCMKSGQVFSQLRQKWFEPDWWKFGNGNSYFRHASGEMLVLSKAVAQFVSINGAILCSYAHDDVSVGSWMIGQDVEYVDEKKLCCSGWSSGAVCATAAAA